MERWGVCVNCGPGEQTQDLSNNPSLEVQTVVDWARWPPAVSFQKGAAANCPASAQPPPVFSFEWAAGVMETSRLPAPRGDSCLTPSGNQFSGVPL